MSKYYPEDNGHRKRKKFSGTPVAFMCYTGILVEVGRADERL